MAHPKRTLAKRPPKLTPAGRAYIRAVRGMERQVDAMEAFLEARGRLGTAGEMRLLWEAFYAGFAAREAMGVGSGGVEPPTSAVSRRRSSTELRASSRVSSRVSRREK